MDMRFKRIMAIVMAAVMIITAAMLVSCKKSGSDNGGSDPAETAEEADNRDDSGNSKPEEVDYDPAHSFVAGKCYVLSGMRSEDEEFDEELIKEMFDISDVSEYMKLYFDKTGKVYMSSLLYKNVQEGDFTVEEGYVLMVVDEDMYEIRDEGNGIISTDREEEDGEVFGLTFREVKEAPKELAKYVK